MSITLHLVFPNAVPCPTESKVYHLDTTVTCSRRCTFIPEVTSIVHSQGIYEIPRPYLTAVPTSKEKKGSKKPDSPAPSSEEDITKLLKSKMPSIFATTESTAPWFETLFPTSKLPELTTDSTIEKTVFNALFKDICTQAKIYIKAANYTAPHLPRSLAAKVQKVIILSVKKSSSAKCPARIIKKAAHLTPPPAKQAPSDKTKSPASKPATKPSPSSKQNKSASTSKAKAPSAPAHKDSPPKKNNAKRSPEQSAPTPVPTVRISDVLTALHESSSPQFYFSADNTPTFKSLFPGTTMPKYSHMSGNITVEKTAFQPLLLTRIKSAHAYLSKRDLKVQKLPAKFLAYQTRLITRSIEKQLENRKQAKATKKAKVASKQGTVTFVPQTMPDSVAAPPRLPSSEESARENDIHEQIKEYRDLRTILQAYQAELPVSEAMKNPSLKKAIYQSEILRAAFPAAYFDRSDTPSASNKIVKLTALKSYESFDPSHRIPDYSLTSSQVSQSSDPLLLSAIKFVVSRSSMIPLPSLE
jgi:hypothetical protein